MKQQNLNKILSLRGVMYRAYIPKTVFDMIWTFLVLAGKVGILYIVSTVELQPKNIFFAYVKRI